MLKSPRLATTYSPGVAATKAPTPATPEVIAKVVAKEGDNAPVTRGRDRVRYMAASRSISRIWLKEAAEQAHKKVPVEVRARVEGESTRGGRPAARKPVAVVDTTNKDKRDFEREEMADRYVIFSLGRRGRGRGRGNSVAGDVGGDGGDDDDRAERLRMRCERERREGEYAASPYLRK